MTAVTTKKRGTVRTALLDAALLDAALLDAALHVLGAQSCGATTVDNLCRAAGVSRSAFFHHFDSKEADDTHPPIRGACARSIGAHAAMVEADIAAAIAGRGIVADRTAESPGLYTQAVLQGAFVLAKAKGGPNVAAECVDHLRRYVATLFGDAAPAATPDTGGPACPNDRNR